MEWESRPKLSSSSEKDESRKGSVGDAGGVACAPCWVSLSTELAFIAIVFQAIKRQALQRSIGTASGGEE